MSNPLVVLQPGDIGVARGRSWLARAIRECEEYPGDEHTFANHAFVITGGGPIGSAVVTEAEWPRVKRWSVIDSYGGNPDYIAIFRRTDINMTQRMAIADKADSYVGERYGTWKLLAHFFDHIGTELTNRKCFWFRDHFCSSDSKPICSWIDAHAVGVLPEACSGGFADAAFGVPNDDCQPEDIWTCCINLPNLWQMVLPPTLIEKA
jgi:hypothetical protein